MPAAARVAAALGLISLVPLALFVVAAVALGGLRSDAGPEWWLSPLLAAPLVQLWGDRRRPVWLGNLAVG